MSRTSRSLYLTVAGVGTLALSLACGGNGTVQIQEPNPPVAAPVSFLVTDAPTDTWSNIGVIIRKATLIPVGGTAAQGVTVYDGTGDTTKLNLVDLDELAELLGTAQIPAGSYDRLVIQVDGDPNHIELVPADGSAQIPAASIIVRGADPVTKLVELPVQLSSPLVVVAGQPNAVQVDFDLGHPLFVVAHTLFGSTTYTLNFQVRHKPHGALHQVYLRHLKGQVASVAADSKSLVLRTERGKDKTLTVDAINKSLFYDLDTTPVAPVASFTVPANLTATKYAKATARFQADGSLTAVRVWYSSDATKLKSWMPEGHVVKVDTTLNQIRVLRENGAPATLQINANTQFYFQSGTTAIGSGTAFLSNLSRGFKVHVTVADPLAAAPLVASSVDIHRGVFEGDITAADASTFTYSKAFMADSTTDTRTVGYDTGFSWWNFTFPTTASTDKTAFLAKAMPASGPHARAMSTLNWVNSSWAAKVAVFLPSQLSRTPQIISGAYSGGTMNVTYTPEGGSATTLTVKLSTNSGSMPLVTEFSKSGMIVSVTPLTSEAQWTAKLVANTKVQVFGIQVRHG